MAECRQIVIILFLLFNSPCRIAIVIRFFLGFQNLVAVRSHVYFTTFRPDTQLDERVPVSFFVWCLHALALFLCFTG